jgi:hypothetical protein
MEVALDWACVLFGGYQKLTRKLVHLEYQDGDHTDTSDISIYDRWIHVTEYLVRIVNIVDVYQRVILR